ncbi:MAG: hypothetical protein PHF57_08165 [Methanoregula sp.]|jgi:hypothetical protein|nr:hypothetical protein [Methanoregula sp.]
MRDPARIPIILEKLNTVWQRYHDLRFGQLVIDLYSLTPKTQRDPNGMSDFFNVEDSDFEVALDQVLERGFE